MIKMILSGDLIPGGKVIDIAMNLVREGVDITLDPQQVAGGLPLSFLPLLSKNPEGQQFDVALGVDCTPVLARCMVGWSIEDMREDRGDLDLMLSPKRLSIRPEATRTATLPFGFDPDRHKPRDPALASARPFRLLVDPQDEYAQHIALELVTQPGFTGKIDVISEANFRDADVMLLPDVPSMAFSQLAIEFMATGGVVVCPDRGPYRAWFSPEIAWERPTLANHVTALLLQLSHQRAQVERMGQAASARVYSELQWPVVTQKLLREIGKVL